jgi:hypothetical protein
MSRKLTPTVKAPAIENILTTITGVSRQDANTSRTCTWCRKPLIPFRNDLSRKEYNISGFCQSCQDDTFAAESDFLD